MEITEILNLVIVGAFLSALLEVITKHLSSTLSKFATIGSALVIGGVYTWLMSTPYAETVFGILGSASLVYALFIKKPSV